MLLLAAGLFAIIPQIYAQEEPFLEEDVLAVDPLFAAEQAIILGEGPDITPAATSTWIVVRMILTLALAAAAIYGIVFFIKRAGKKTVTADPFLKVLASAHLGTNRYTHVVCVGTQAWLVGSSEGGVNLIGEIADKEILDAMMLEDSRKSAETSTGRLADFLSIFRRGIPGGTPHVTNTPGAEDIRKRRERLMGL